MCSCSTQMHAHTPRHAHTHRAPTHAGMRTQRCMHTETERRRFSDASHWLALEQNPSFVGSNKGFQASPVVKAVNFKGEKAL